MKTARFLPIALGILAMSGCGSEPKSEPPIVIDEPERKIDIYCSADGGVIAAPGVALTEFSQAHFNVFGLSLVEASRHVMRYAVPSEVVGPPDGIRYDIDQIDNGILLRSMSFEIAGLSIEHKGLEMCSKVYSMVQENRLHVQKEGQ